MRRLVLALFALMAMVAFAPAIARAQRADNPHGASVNGNTCSACHRADGWRPAVIAREFKHAPQTFPLDGAHARTTCASCHKTLDFSQAVTSCASCHQDVHKGELGTQCARCHTARTFTDRAAMARLHQTGRFPLQGGHATVACESCHTPARNGQLEFVNRATTCIGCHAETFRNAKAPDHVAAGFSQNCTTCHTLATWSTANFDHSRTRFPLTLGHAGRTCESCHADKVFVGKSMACASCHTGDFQRTTNPPHAQGFPTLCADCHTTAAWTGAKFDHATTRFPLAGAHTNVSCNGCHGDKIFRGKVTTCIGCHQKDFSQTLSPSHGAARFSTECLTCHTMTQWKGATFDHSKTRFPLTERHATVTCQGCHADGVYVGKPMGCASCHQTAYDATTQPPHAAAGFPTLCESCHKSAAAWGGAPYDHNTTRFPLTGAHRTATCLDCHGDRVYKGKAMECASCHQARYNATTNPPHVKAGFSTTCSTCHTTTQWTGAVFDHSKTRFPLTNGHAGRECAACHGDGIYTGKSLECVSCHQSDFTATKKPPHASAGFPTTCASCHSTVAWTGGVFDHAATRFPLTGAHLTTTCADCHSDGVYKGKPTACLSCHQSDFTATKNPPHATLGFPGTCETCHTTARWQGAVFDHNKTSYPLTGAHIAASCTGCHSTGVYKGTPTTCVSCHQTDYTASTNPPHAQAGFPTVCASCHTTAAWKGAKFDHNATKFPLVGAHITASCKDCHSDGVYAGKPTTCVSCHLANYNATTQPNHKVGGIPTTCEGCHNTLSWLGKTNFDHNVDTQFPLTGAHQSTACLGCHASGVYKGLPTTCVSCHTPGYNASTNPHHIQAGFSTVCASCHSTNGWNLAPYDHNQTSFPLTGAHVGKECIACHADKVYKGKPTTCITCHQTDYNGAKSPNHVSSGFPTTCETCHTTTQWNGAVFNHNATAFPLTGAHKTATCVDCHSSGVYKGLPTACASCHTPEYNASTNPHHIQAGFSKLCASCHTTTQWPGAPYNHNTLTSFPLTGAHVGKACISCHADKVYNGKPTTCVSCHLTDYNNTTKPKHSTSGFPTTCETCHTSTQWLGASFNHSTTAFPLTGAHLTATCLDCHASGVYKGLPTACASCHTPEYNASTNPHHIQAGFSKLCASCHTTTKWPGAPYNHNTQTSFPLTGAHVGKTCISCHADKVYNGKPTTCVSCHLTDYNNTTKPKHSTSGFPTDCQTCHTTTQWLGAVFNHSATNFPLTGAHLTATCLDCHSSGVYKGLPTACASCHTPEYNASTNPHHIQAGFSTLCASCHTTSQWPGGTYNHNTQTSFPLTGAHIGKTCISCHADKVYKGKPTTCVSCHLTDYNNTTSPKHSTAGFPTDCQTCHTTTKWLGAVFNHSATNFPLTGAHLAASCLDCHSSGVYKGLPTACASCHTPEYNASTNPHHIQAGFSTLCASCHTTTQWPGGTYNHNTQTSFPLTGAHIGKSCISCHADKVYNGKPTTCVSCHLTDYNNTTNPKHSTSGFPTDCAACHTTTQWLGAVFNHDGPYFPIYSGKHRQAWTSCADCHVNSSNYKQFECILCHQHNNKTKVDADHRGQRGYSYNSAACYQCHPRGTSN